MFLIQKFSKLDYIREYLYLILQTHYIIANVLYSAKVKEKT